jgi:hypothetical protein
VVVTLIWYPPVSVSNQALGGAQALAHGLSSGRAALFFPRSGTISAADLVTDAVVHPEPLDDWLPDSIKRVRLAGHEGQRLPAPAVHHPHTCV